MYSDRCHLKLMTFIIGVEGWSERKVDDFAGEVGLNVVSF